MTSELFKVSKKVPLIDDDGDLVNKELGIKLKGFKRLGRCGYQIVEKGGVKFYSTNVDYLLVRLLRDDVAIREKALELYG